MEEQKVHICPKDMWIIAGMLFGHTIAVFGGLLHWTNRIVAVESAVASVTKTVDNSLPALQSDVKQILQRMPRNQQRQQ